jgi:Na+-driven multidrug efflux pump
VFRDDAAVISVGTRALRWQLITLPFCGYLMMSNMLMQTIRKPWRANILASARKGLFFIPLIIFLPIYLGLSGVEMCQAVSDILSLIITVPIIFFAFREMKHV